MKNFHRGSEDCKNYSIEISSKLKKYEINSPIFYIKCFTIHTYIYINYDFRVKIAQHKIHKFLWVDKNRYLRGIDRQTNLWNIFIRRHECFHRLSIDNPTTERWSKSFPCFRAQRVKLGFDVIFLSVARIVFSAYHRTTIIRHPLDRFSALLQFVSIQLQLSLGLTSDCPTWKIIDDRLKKKKEKKIGGNKGGVHISRKYISRNAVRGGGDGDKLADAASNCYVWW